MMTAKEAYETLIKEAATDGDYEIEVKYISDCDQQGLESLK
jgi:hypothetical protein